MVRVRTGPSRDSPFTCHPCGQFFQSPHLTKWDLLRAVCIECAQPAAAETGAVARACEFSSQNPRWGNGLLSAFSRCQIKPTRETKQLFFSNTALFLSLTHVSNHGRRIALVRLLNCKLSFFPCLRITHVTLLSDSLGSRTVPRHIIFFLLSQPQFTFRRVTHPVIRDGVIVSRPSTSFSRNFIVNCPSCRLLFPNLNLDSPRNERRRGNQAHRGCPR